VRAAWGGIIPQGPSVQAKGCTDAQGVDNFVKNFDFFSFSNALVFKINLKSRFLF